jgi:hypothetical protein
MAEPGWRVMDVTSSSPQFNVCLYCPSRSSAVSVVDPRYAKIQGVQQFHELVLTV